MSDFQGALKELIMPAGSGARTTPKPWSGGQPKGAVVGKHVRARHKLVVALAVAGYRNSEIAAELGYTPGRVSIILNSKHPELAEHRSQIQNQVAINTGDLVLSFHAESRKSLNTLVKIRDKEDAPLSEQRLSALAILDRAGYSPVKKQINVDATLPAQELHSIMGQIEHANEVAARRSEWQIADVPKPSDR